MAKLTLSDITTGYASSESYNANNALIEAAFENTLSRDGSTPNDMEADLDMGGNDILNAGAVAVDSLTVNGTNVVATDDLTSVPNWEGSWTTLTAYQVNDLVRNSGSTYICVSAHTSGTFSTDLSNSLWELFAQQGAAGAGTGDMLAANNLSDVSDAATSLSNLGGQPLDSVLTMLSGETLTAVTGSDANVVTGTAGASGQLGGWDANGDMVDSGYSVVDEDDMTSDSAVKVPTQQSVKAYVDSQVSGGTSLSSEVATTSGTTATISSVPSGCYEVKLLLKGVSLSGSNNLQLKLGHSSGTYDTGVYTAGRGDDVNSFGASGSDAFGLHRASTAGAKSSGVLTLTHFGSNIWGLSGNLVLDSGSTVECAGQVTISGALTDVQLTPNGGNSFDAGSIIARFYT